jgi:hypothetical protein
MLKNFIYLNEPALDGYLSALEDGLRGSVQATTATTASLTGKAGVAGIGVSGDRESQQGETTSRTDTAAARFERLQKLAREDVEASGWVDVANPETDLSGLGTGALIELECEVYVPEIIKMLSPGGGLAKAVDQIQALAQIAPAFGSQLTGMPAQGQLDAMKGFASALGGDAVFVGEPDGTDRRVAGKLLDQYLNVEVEGFARVVGKVSAQWGKGQWKPLLALPGMNLQSREQRRAMERQGPDEGQEQNWLEGPAIMLDVLAIYR